MNSNDPHTAKSPSLSRTTSQNSRRLLGEKKAEPKEKSSSSIVALLAFAPPLFSIIFGEGALFDFILFILCILLLISMIQKPEELLEHAKLKTESCAKGIGTEEELKQCQNQERNMIMLILTMPILGGFFIHYLQQFSGGAFVQHLHPLLFTVPLLLRALHRAFDHSKEDGEELIKTVANRAQKIDRQVQSLEEAIRVSYVNSEQQMEEINKLNTALDNVIEKNKAREVSIQKIRKMLKRNNIGPSRKVKSTRGNVAAAAASSTIPPLSSSSSSSSLVSIVNEGCDCDLELVHHPTCRKVLASKRLMVCSCSYGGYDHPHDFLNMGCAMHINADSNDRTNMINDDTGYNNSITNNSEIHGSKKNLNFSYNNGIGNSIHNQNLNHHHHHHRSINSNNNNNNNENGHGISGNDNGNDNTNCNNDPSYSFPTTKLAFGNNSNLSDKGHHIKSGSNLKANNTNYAITTSERGNNADQNNFYTNKNIGIWAMLKPERPMVKINQIYLFCYLILLRLAQIFRIARFLPFTETPTAPITEQLSPTKIGGNRSYDSPSMRLQYRERSRIQ